ncbi:MAG TPA: B-box zinc finger protein [Acidobacteriaceae bacterium]|jgi:hypothetical protein
MNCNYHPDVPSSAFCQFCGKPLCKDCVRNVGGSVFCEACLAERLRGTGAGAPTTPIFTGTPHPMLAGLLGVIPGVGAMYNGQYAKAIAHVLIFAVLASLSDHTSGVFGILCFAWVCYQVFDAYQTAIARRDGLPLPNPFGLNDIAQRLGIHPHPGTYPGTYPGAYPNAGTYPGPVPPVPPVPPPSASGWEPVTGAGQPGQPGPSAAGFVPPAGAAGFTPGQPYSGQPYYGQPGYGQGYVPGQPYPPPPPFAPGYRDIPTGAIVLIGLGILFLFGSLGLLHHNWIAHAWPLLIIGLGLWIIFRRTRGVPLAPPPPDASIHSPGHTHSVPTQPGPGDPAGGTR